MKKREKTRQISFRAEVPLAEEIETAAKFEERSVADFVRIIFRYTWRDYKAAGSLAVLRARDAESYERPASQTANKRKSA
jgi:hypothetical protein